MTLSNEILLEILSNLRDRFQAISNEYIIPDHLSDLLVDLKSRTALEIETETVIEDLQSLEEELHYLEYLDYMEDCDYDEFGFLEYNPPVLNNNLEGRCRKCHEMINIYATVQPSCSCDLYYKFIKKTLDGYDCLLCSKQTIVRFNMYNHLKVKHQKDLNLGGAENVEEVEEKCNSTSTGSSSESLKENNSRQIHNSPQKMMEKNPSSVVTNVVFNENELKNKSKTMKNCEKEEMAVLEQLSGMQNLEMISLLHNPVVSKPNYRLFVIHKFSNLRVLDFKKVKQKEHDSTKELFKSKKGKEQFKGVVQVRIMRDWKGRKKKQKFLKN